MADQTSNSSEQKVVYDIEQVREILPHRYPFLLVDKILELEPGKKCVGLKNVTANEKFFNGHFPGHAVFPGALLVEAMAQVGCVLMLTTAETKDKIAYFAAVDGIRFRKPIVPGDTVITTVEFLAFKRGIGKVTAKATVDGRVVCEGVFTCALVDRRNEPENNGKAE